MPARCHAVGVSSSADVVAGIAVRITLQIILVLRLSLPEVACGNKFGDDFPGQKTRCFDIGDRISNLFLLVVLVEDCGAVARTAIGSLDV